MQKKIKKNSKKVLTNWGLSCIIDIVDGHAKAQRKEMITMAMKKYLLMVDTETANSMDDPLTYDVSIAVADLRGNIYERFPMVVREIYERKELTTSAYYAGKMPKYAEALKNGTRQIASLYEIRKLILALMKKYHTNTVCMHNARFDVNALNVTERYTTQSRYRYFFPKGTEVWDTMLMAIDTIAKQKSYIRFCEKNGYMTKHKTPRPKITAEVLYRYIMKDVDFVEEHMGIEDVEIETAILAHCIRQHKKMRRVLYPAR